MTEPRLSPNSSALTSVAGSLFVALFLFPLLAAAIPEKSGVDTSTEFSIPALDKVWIFPRDHASHPDFQTEWWYFTGQLFVDDRKRTQAPLSEDLFQAQADFGFQLTFFRRALFSAPLGTANGDALLAHGAFTDVKASNFTFEKRYQRQGISSELSQASTSTLDVSVGNWQARLNPQDASEIELYYSVENIEVKLLAKVTLLPMYQGENGFSRKGTCNTCASHYYSLPRLELSGTVTKDGETKSVRGLGWMDHEFMSNALQPEQEGWDWISLMTNNGDSIMFFRLRSRNKSAQYSACSIMSKDGVTRSCRAEFNTKKFWHSPRSGARYPSHVELLIDDLTFQLIPLISDQELSDESMSYYEGAIRDANGKGFGYMELTGYDKPLTQRF